MKTRTRNLAVVGLTAGVAVMALGAGGAQAASLIGSRGILDNSIQSVDVKDDALRGSDIKDGTLQTRDLSSTAIAALRGAAGARGPQGVTGPQGPQGDKGAKGEDGLAGAFYAVAYYNAGDTNAGAVATVACDSESSAYTAIAGGVQVLGLDGTALTRNTPVSSSFPGRMDWSTGTPKQGRLDGWIVQFGGNAGQTSDVAPEKVKVWAMCVPTTAIPVHETWTQS